MYVFLNGFHITWSHVKKKNQTVNWKAAPKNDVMKQIDRTQQGIVLPLSRASAAQI